VGATGLGQIFEVVRQLRHDHPNQVKDARIGLTPQPRRYRRGLHGVDPARGAMMLMRRCALCRESLTPVATVCPSCLSREVETTEMPSQGRLVTWTTIRRAPAGYPVAAPYDVVVVDLASGGRVTGRLATDSPPPSMDATVRLVGEEGACAIFAVETT
jgi:uncharacterized OB-fold protein